MQIQIANDNQAIESSFSSLVTAYNAVIKDINGQEKLDSTGKAEPLFGNPTLSLIQGQLQSAIYGGTANGSISSVSQLGIEIQSDGTLTLNVNTLDAALNANFSDVAGYLQNPTTFGQKLASIVNDLGSQAPGGAVYLSQQQNTAQEASINKTLTAQQAAIAAQKITLTQQLTTANQELQSIPQQLLEINQIYSAISGYNQQR